MDGRLLERELFNWGAQTARGALVTIPAVLANPSVSVAAPPLQVGIYEFVEVSVQNALHVAHFDLGSKVLDHLIRLEDITAKLSTPCSFTLFAPYLVELVKLALAGYVRQS
jgi:hypothetical protein